MDNIKMEEKIKSDKFSIKDLKKEYEKYKDKYKLPEFHELNEVFDSEEIEIETEFFLRRLRKLIAERIDGYLRFLEIIINPSNAPMFFFRVINRLSEAEKAELTKLYEQLGDLELESIRLDLDYNEKKEAEFIKNVFNEFGKIRPSLLGILENMINGDDKKKTEERSYFG
jgi:hypothetical protein